MPLNILVTGGTGFLGAHVLEALAEAGHARASLGRNPDRRAARGAVHALADIRDYEAVAEAVSKSDRVIHLAGLVGTALSIQQPEDFISTNVLGSINVFDACRFFNKPCLLASVGNADEQSLYAITKATAERLALMYRKEHGVRILIARIFNTYGEGQRTGPAGKLVASAVAAAIAGRPITIYGDGEQVDDFIYVKDVARILARVAAEDGHDPRTVWHVGTGQGTSVRRVVELIVRLTGSKSEIVRAGDRRPGQADGSPIADPARFPMPDYSFTPLEQGLRATIDHARSSMPTAAGASE